MRERIVRAVAGFLVIVGVILSYFISELWLLLPIFVGFNLFQSSITRFCPLEILLDKMKVK